MNNAVQSYFRNRQLLAMCRDQNRADDARRGSGSRKRKIAKRFARVMARRMRAGR